MAKAQKEKKIFVLDTSVILYSHDSIMNFAEHDVVIPITVLEELDQFKKGNDTKNFEAREFIRLLDKLSKSNMLHNWNPLNGKTKGNFKVIMNEDAMNDAMKIFGDAKNDHRILNAALRVKQENPGRKVILVSKDINLRLKAKSLDLNAEDYETGKIKNVNELYTGRSVREDIAPEVIDKLYQTGSCTVREAMKRSKPVQNGYYILKSETNSALSVYNPIEKRM